MSEQTTELSLFDEFASMFDRANYNALKEEMTLAEYVAACEENPKLIRTAHQYIYDMITEPGSYQFERYRTKYVHYNFFDGPDVAIYGLEEPLDNIVNFIKGAAGHYGPEKRILLLHGPVGSSKSTICNSLKNGLERYSRTKAGAWYTLKWVNLPIGKDGIFVDTENLCPLHEQPLKLFAPEIRKKLVDRLNDKLLDSIQHEDEKTTKKLRDEQYRLVCKGSLCPRCEVFFNLLLERYNGDWKKVIEEHVRVVRMVHSENNRMGIGTFQPKDEKNQDATELTGDISYKLLPYFGSDSDPRAFNYDGEFPVANRGMLEWVEVLKLQSEFLYDLLEGTQFQRVKPKKSPQIEIDEFMISHTNNPEFLKFQNDEFMEALKDRTYKIDIPYVLEWDTEVKILKHDYNKKNVKQHIAPWTIEIGALWSTLTRLHQDDVDLVDKAKMYNGSMKDGFNEDRIKEMRLKAQEKGEGFSGVSVRYVQDRLSYCLSNNYKYINPFMLLGAIRDGLMHSPLISDKDQIQFYLDCAKWAEGEYAEIVKKEVQNALITDENAIVRIFSNYIDNVIAHVEEKEVWDDYTRRWVKPNEKLMRSIEGQIDIPGTKSNDFRLQITKFIAGCSHRNEEFKWDTDERLKKALENKLFQDSQDTLKISALNTEGVSVVDPDIQKRIDDLKQRLIKRGYNEESATDVLNFVGNIFQRSKSEED